MDIFISESSYGMHIPATKEINANLISFTFRPSYYSLSEKITNITGQVRISISKTTALKVEGEPDSKIQALFDDCGRDIISFILAKAEEWQSKKIYLGQDLDENGELMASLLYYHLLESGVPHDRLFRVPLIETGYDYLNIGFSDFYPKEQLKEILNLDIEEQRMMLKHPRTLLGFRNLFALSHINTMIQNKTNIVFRKSTGTNTATAITKIVIGED